MNATFRESMNWLHTWAGVILGGLLFAIFWTGTLSVFDREIDRWMAPKTRLVPPAAGWTIDSEAVRATHGLASAAKSPTFVAIFPNERTPVLRVTWREKSGVVQRLIDPGNGTELPDVGTWAGTGFLYPFHYMLHIRFERAGYWIVGLAAMAMMALCVSGVVVHRRIFSDFFTVRSEKKPRRVLLDLHNVTGVLGLPFHFVITLSGLVIFYLVYLPGVFQLVYDGKTRMFGSESVGHYERPRLGKPGELASLDAMVKEATIKWDGASPHHVNVWHPGDAASYVQVSYRSEDQVPNNVDAAYFDAATGALLRKRDEPRPVLSVQQFIAGLHLINFRHWTLRWLYFGLGLSGCVLIATGYLFWLESRRKKHTASGRSGVRIVEGLTIGSTTGILAATFAFFVVNRLLPLGVTFAGWERPELEIWTFYLVWLATFAHAWLRPARAWIEQCWTIAVLCAAAVALNWITTGDHLAHSLVHRHLWPVAGMDAMMLTAAVAAFATARALARKRSAASTPAPARIARKA